MPNDVFFALDAVLAKATQLRHVQVLDAGLWDPLRQAFFVDIRMPAAAWKATHINQNFGVYTMQQVGNLGLAGRAVAERQYEIGLAHFHYLVNGQHLKTPSVIICDLNDRVCALELLH